MHGVIVEFPAPSDSWCQTLAQDPALDVSVELILPMADGSCRERVHVKGGTSELVERIRGAPYVRDAALREETKDGATFLVDTAACPVANMMRRSGVMPELPFKVCKGADRWLVIDQKDALQEALRLMRDGGAPPKVIWSGPWTDEDYLTPRQRVVLQAAVAQGFYAHPRRIDLTRLAETLGITKSTLSQTLMRIEERVMTRLVD